MYKINKIATDKHNFFQMMQGIAKLPKSLFLLGNLPAEHRPTVAIVGSRKPTPYGQNVAYRISYELAQAGVVVISGMALGIDAIAHKAALDAGGTTVAVLPGALDNPYPRTNIPLARRIVAGGSALISQYEPGQEIWPRNFIERNQIAAAISDGVLVVEAATKSGTLHTAGFALDFGRPVMAIPGDITNPLSGGTNNLIKTGARLISQTSDILEEIGARTTGQQTQLPLADSPEEAAILNLLANGVRDGELLQQQSKLPPALFSQTLTMLEITNKIRPLGGNQWGL